MQSSGLRKLSLITLHSSYNLSSTCFIIPEDMMEMLFLCRKKRKKKYKVFLMLLCYFLVLSLYKKFTLFLNANTSNSVLEGKTSLSLPIGFT